ncbi:MAG TPA: diguanylate cyclase [Desulfobacteraceae bacterium]|nr:diguanylate cyclase [Desulfobacteraceae bacterium]
MIILRGRLNPPLHEPRGRIPAILITGQGNEAVAVAAMKKGARDYLIKGEISEDSFCKAIQSAIKEHETERKKAVMFNKSVYHDSSGHIAGIIGIITDITERKQYETKIYQLAMFDQLTGAASRSHFLECLSNAFKRLKRNQKSLAVLYIDLDGFKEINDTYGHRSGDVVLQELARRMMALLRETDTLGRMGGGRIYHFNRERKQPKRRCSGYRKNSGPL